MSKLTVNLAKNASQSYKNGFGVDFDRFSPTIKTVHIGSAAHDAGLLVSDVVEMINEMLIPKTATGYSVNGTLTTLFNFTNGIVKIGSVRKVVGVNLSVHLFLRLESNSLFLFLFFPEADVAMAVASGSTSVFSNNAGPLQGKMFILLSIFLGEQVLY